MSRSFQELLETYAKAVWDCADALHTPGADLHEANNRRLKLRQQLDAVDAPEPSRLITLPIQCGEETCYDFDTQTMCNYAYSRGFGKTFICALFPSSEGTSTTLKTRDNKPEGALLRCSRCLAREVR